VPPGHPNTLPRGGAESLPKQELDEARERTLALVEPVSDADLDRVHSTLMSPLVWDLGHIAAFEDLWVSGETGADPLRGELFEVYDAAETPRRKRGDLPYLHRLDALGYLEQVRERTLSVLEPHGFLWDLILQHEHQHNETMLQTLKLAEPGTYAPPRRELPRELPEGPDTVVVEGGSFVMGDPGGGFAYDNERPRQEVHVDTFELDRVPVTNGAYMEFVEDGGEPPLYWTGDGRIRDFERTVPIDPELPVAHVSWVQADAYARWRGARLPTEAEWEKAARAGVEDRRFPWGDERPDATFGRPPRVGWTLANALGLTDLSGVCHEWCADWYDDAYYLHSPARNPCGPESGERRVSRGGAWRHADPWSPVAHRSSLPPHLRYSDYGVRLVRA
jgi:iron(II)-dependent oxidoreductase